MSISAPTGSVKTAVAGAVRRPRVARVLLGLALAAGAIVVIAAGIGAVRIGPGQVLAVIASELGIDLPWAATAQERAIVWTIRLPRVLLAALVGAALAVSGAALQGLVRNPLVDPGLVGVSSGASLGAVAYLVLGAPVAAALPAAGPWLLPAMAFAGGLVTTLIALGLARVDGRTSPVALLLGGIALAALTGAATGVLIYAADDAQLRSITFWTLGSVAGATWSLVGVVAIPMVIALLVLPRLAGDLDRMLLGDAEARHLGVDVERTVRQVAALTALAVGAAVAACGVIGFVGLIVPHLVRGWLGPSHRTLMPAAALGGAILLVGADLIARTVVVPRELPVGIVTALAGAPLLIVLVRRGRGREVAP